MRTRRGGNGNEDRPTSDGFSFFPPFLLRAQWAAFIIYSFLLQTWKWKIKRIETVRVSIKKCFEIDWRVACWWNDFSLRFEIVIRDGIICDVDNYWWNYGNLHTKSWRYCDQRPSCGSILRSKFIASLFEAMLLKLDNFSGNRGQRWFLMTHDNSASNSNSSSASNCDFKWFQWL